MSLNSIKSQRNTPPSKSEMASRSAKINDARRKNLRRQKLTFHDRLLSDDVMHDLLPYYKYDADGEITWELRRHVQLVLDRPFDEIDDALLPAYCPVDNHDPNGPLRVKVEKKKNQIRVIMAGGRDIEVFDPSREIGVDAVSPAQVHALGYSLYKTTHATVASTLGNERFSKGTEKNRGRQAKLRRKRNLLQFAHDKWQSAVKNANSAITNLRKRAEEKRA